jgi:hypothetical protein
MSKLNKKANDLYNSYVDSNIADVNQSEVIRGYLEQKKTGYNEIIKIAEKLKATAEVNGLTVKQACAKIKTQVSRELNKGDTGLSLQGLGVDQTVEIKVKSGDNLPKEGVIAEVREKPENSVNPATLSITHEQAWDFVEKYYTLDDVQALLGAVKSRVASQLAEEVPAIANEVV